ncbi:hypothetical protein OH76DRAFT_1365474 [Lentinus brumalis]|uniref:Uncharacterized protein n=1 Tax=Lentinus brumalis TaxID=2498619 RepID=A0A371CKT9_9APHY|nr:hypothetical protein OH76DRAFT_1365474 [Polyporus brumalis]
MLLLGYPKKSGEEVEEVILRVQGFLQDAHLPPIRNNHIPRNHARLMDMKQSITLVGFGAERFDCAVRGLGSIYQYFNRHVARTGSRLREWTPGRDGANATLTFANRYLSSARDAVGEVPADLADVVDPFNVLRPLLHTEVHTQDNVVEYWQRQDNKLTSHSERFVRIKPDAFSISNMVEVQIGFIAVKTGRTEYIFLPKLRSIFCQDYNTVAIRNLSQKKHISPLKKVKRKVGYGDDSAEPNEDGPPQEQMKRLRIDDEQPQVQERAMSV